MVSVSVTCTTDWCTPAPPASIHSCAPVPPMILPPPEGLLPHVELPIPMLWPPGMCLGQNKITSTVTHRGRCVALDGHDCGYMIPHIPIPPVPVNLLLFLSIIPFSSRKVAFTASTVSFDAAAVACVKPYLPMMTCMNPVSLPTTFAFNFTNTVSVGMTATDIALGLVGIMVSAITDLVCDRLAGGRWSSPRSVRNSVIESFRSTNAARRLMSDATVRDWVLHRLGGRIARAAVSRRGEILEQLVLGGTASQYGARAAGGALTGLVRTAVTGSGSVSLGVGQPFFGTQGTVSVARHVGPVDGTTRNVGGHDVSGSTQWGYFNHSETHQTNANHSETDVVTDNAPLGSRTTTHQHDAAGRPLPGDGAVTDNHPWGSAL